MERKLELKDIAGYLPYGLIWRGITVGTEFTTKEQSNKNYSLNSVESLFLNDRTKENTPILRPLSDLDKTITHNGEEFIPIVKLAKIVMYNAPYLVDTYTLLSDNSVKITYSHSADCFIFDFCKINKIFSLESVNTLHGKTPQYKLFYNQYQLFDKLNEWKIDYRGLIEKGYAIDANTLDINPYK